MNVKFSSQDALFFVEKLITDPRKADAEAALQTALNRTGRGNDFLGWITLPNDVTEADITRIEECAARMADKSEVVVVVGIGGSYLGARAVIEALQHSFAPYVEGKFPHILYAGNNINEDYLHDLLDVLDTRDYSVVVISKSGTTTEPALAFRVLKRLVQAAFA